MHINNSVDRNKFFNKNLKDLQKLEDTLFYILINISDDLDNNKTIISKRYCGQIGELKLLDNSETDTPFTLIKLLNTLIEDIPKLEKRINVIQMDNDLLHHYIQKLLKKIQKASQRK